MKIEIRAQAFAPWEELGDYQARLPAGGYGACAAFVGTMRDFHDGARVSKMTLEHYAGMTERQLRQLTDAAARRHGLLDALVVHRVGELLPNEPIVLVAAWSAHRAAAFAACSEIMEALKSRATFWKKETLPDGERWVERNTPRA
ncbi:MAG: molybdenum cofactor biosynthesis protein MoaE [Gammaproteobacteria bacterium]